MKKIILASGSPRRKQFFDDLRIDYELIPSSFEEDMTQDLPPEELAIDLALGKAKDIADTVEEGVVIGCDTFCYYDGKVIGKPKSEEDACNMLRLFAGNNIEVHSGLVAIDKYQNKIIKKSEISKVFFTNLTDEEIKGYVATGEAMDKAGSFSFQGRGAMMIEKVEGCYSNVIGLPMNKLKEIFEELEIDWV